MDKQRDFYSAESAIHIRAYLALQEENVRLQHVNTALHRGLRDYGQIVDGLRDTIDALRQEVARLTPGPQWERERDCYDVNDEYTN